MCNSKGHGYRLKLVSCECVRSVISVTFKRSKLLEMV